MCGERRATAGRDVSMRVMVDTSMELARSLVQQLHDTSEVSRDTSSADMGGRGRGDQRGGSLDSDGTRLHRSMQFWRSPIAKCARGKRESMFLNAKQLM